MKFIADFHIHSRFSIATSKNLTPEHLEYWAKIKGINVVATGDCVHPGWLAELKEKLVPSDNGLYTLNKDYILEESRNLKTAGMPEKVYFILTGEISSIYKKNDKVRKVHNICIFPDFNAVEKMQLRLAKAGNIESDGRPILGLDSKIILEMNLESSVKSFLIPAHIWTPWFSVLGSKSGFDSIEECYEDLTPNIFALETGLSSDPAMNRICSFLDKFKLVSNSDAHSPEKLGREANLFDAELSYDGIYNSLKGDEGFLGTIEFFPQEGKYHYDGHRNCGENGIKFNPLETLNHNSVCPVCGKEVTKGVMYRVAELADRDLPAEYNGSNFKSITQLPNILAEILDKKNSSSKIIKQEYFRLINAIGSEFYILTEAPVDEIKENGGEILSEAVRRLRAGEVIIDDGYDGEFGRIKLFNEGETKSFIAGGLFSSDKTSNSNKIKSIEFDVDSFKNLYKKINPAETKKNISSEKHKLKLNPNQDKAVSHTIGVCIVIAGPGSGKTRILTERIIRLIKNGTAPENILSLTFSNKAADEIKKRLISAPLNDRISTSRNDRISTTLNDLAESDNTGDKVISSTFHSFGMKFLEQYFEEAGLKQNFYIADKDECLEIITQITGEKKSIREFKIIESIKNGTAAPSDSKIFKKYNDELKKRNSIDISDLVYIPKNVLSDNPEIRKEISEKYKYILVDEFQDINSVQYDFIKLISSGENPNLFVIGDPDQSIYGFRGSSPDYIRLIQEDFPKSIMIEMDISYRSPGAILKAARNILKKKEKMTGENRDIEFLVQENETDKSEADWIASMIEKMTGGVRSFSMDSGIADGNSGDYGFSDFAVLCRSSFMFDLFRESFSNHGIPVEIVETSSEMNSEPSISIIRLIKRYFYNRHIHSEFLEISNDTIRMIDNTDSIENVVKNISISNNINEKHISKLMNLAKNCGNSYEEFFRKINTREGIDDFDDRAEAVTLMTIHASKGLEFENVFIPGCEDNIIPFELFGKLDKEKFSEEERLLYVGITRSRQNLYLSWSHKRNYNGKVFDQKRSRLLDRIEKELAVESKRERKPGDPSRQLDLF